MIAMITFILLRVCVCMCMCACARFPKNVDKLIIRYLWVLISFLGLKDLGPIPILPLPKISSLSLPLIPTPQPYPLILPQRNRMTNLQDPYVNSSRWQGFDLYLVFNLLIQYLSLFNWNAFLFNWNTFLFKGLAFSLKSSHTYKWKFFTYMSEVFKIVCEWFHVCMWERNFQLCIWAHFTSTCESITVVYVKGSTSCYESFSVVCVEFSV